MNSPKVVVVGSSNTDMIIKMERIPRPGETIIGGDFFMAAGGKGANQAVAAARLGGEVTFVAKVGTDMFGKQAIENFKQEGINADFVVEAPENPSGVALIFVDQKGENSIAVASGANNSLADQDVTAAQGKLEESDVLLLQLETPLDTVRHAARLAAEQGVTVILNPAPARELDDELLSYITVLTPNETETELLTGVKVVNEESGRAAAQVLRSRGVTNVVITLGSEGSLIACALAEGKSLEEAARFANLAGALSATKMGAQPSLPTREELQQFSGE
jgi:ribokinase